MPSRVSAATPATTPTVRKGPRSARHPSYATPANAAGATPNKATAEDPYNGRAVSPPSASACWSNAAPSATLTSPTPPRATTRSMSVHRDIARPRAAETSQGSVSHTTGRTDEGSIDTANPIVVGAHPGRWHTTSGGRYARSERRAVRILSPRHLPPAAQVEATIELVLASEDDRRLMLTVREADGLCREREFDTASGRFLSRSEREAELPPDAPWPLEDAPGYQAYASHGLHEGTDVRMVAVDITDPNGARVSSLRVAANAPGPSPVDRAIAAALTRHRDGQAAADRTGPERIAALTRTIHGWRRARGESGLPEDDIYTPELLAALRATEPDLDRLLPEVLTGVARLGGLDPEQVSTAFRVGTGWDARVRRA